MTPRQKLVKDVVFALRCKYRHLPEVNKLDIEEVLDGYKDLGDRFDRVCRSFSRFVSDVQKEWRLR